jgi:phosphoglycolate phosphatase
VTDRPDPILVLFDIDGTLLLTHGAGVRGMALAFEELFGVPSALDGVAISGRTDRAILADTFVKTGVEDSPANVVRFRDCYFQHLADELGRAETRVLPGVHDTLDALEGDDRFIVALLTGNFAGGAKLKLGSAGVWERFAFGSFGDDFLIRRDLMPVALERARQAGRPASRAIVIGDTPLDVDCAHVHGELAVAVATGGFGMDELRATGAELVLETLEGLAPAADTLALLGRRDRSARAR